MKKIKPNVVLFFLVIVLFFYNNTWGACIGASPTWTSTPDRTSVASCVSSASAGDTINVTAGDGSETWSSGITINKTLSIIGPGKENLTITVTSSAVAFTLKAPVGGINATRISGFTFDLNAASGWVYVSCDENDGCPQNWRVDHNEVINPNGHFTCVQIYGNSTCFPYGLIDNNQLERCRIGSFGGAYGMSAAMNKRWYEPTGLGEVQALYVEDNVFNIPIYNPSFDNFCDGNLGGRYVYRYNIGVNGWTETHSVQGYQERAMRMWEVYRNSQSCTAGCPGASPHRMRGSTGVAFDNIATGYSAHDIWLDNVRDSAPSGSWGICDGSSWIDGNETGKSGYLCRDQVGAGRDTSVWDYSQPAPSQEKQPVYAWGNRYDGANMLPFVSANETHIAANRDYYNENPSFNGTTGVGVGVLANRPATCTKGVAYWATDQGSWNKSGRGGQGVLYKCTAPNTWTLYYTPYTYPHPLQGDIPSPPRNLRIIQ